MSRFYIPISLFFQLCSLPLSMACGYDWVGGCSTSIHLRINGTLDSFSVAACPNAHRFNGLQLGSLQSLSLANAKAITWESCQNNVTSVSLRYRVYPIGTAPGAFQSLNLSEDFSTNDGAYTTRYRSQASNINLSGGLIAGETYALEAYFLAEVDTIGDDFVPETFFTQDNNGQNYRLTFIYGGPGAPPFVAAITENSGPTCASDQNGTLTVGVWGDLTDIHYEWSNVALNFPQQIGLAAGTYTVTVTGSSHTIIVSATLTPSYDPGAYLSPLPAQIVVTCNEPTVELCATTAPNVTYQWKKDGLIGPTTPCIIATAGGVYTLSVSENGCIATATIFSEEHKVSPLASATGTASYVMNCYTVDSTITQYHVGTNAVNPTFEWYLQGQLISTESTLTLRSPGLVTFNPSVKVSDQFGCSVEVSSFVILPQPPIPPYLSIYFATNLCHPDQTSVEYNIFGSIAGPTIVTFNGELSPQSPFLASPGQYQVVITDANGCILTQTIFVPAAFSISVEHNQFPQFYNGSISINSSGGLSALWSDGNTNTYRYGLAPGTYCVTISQWNNTCTLDTCIVVLGPSSVSEVSEGAMLRISPNPAQAGGWSTVQTSHGEWTENTQAILYDMSGRAVWAPTIPITQEVVQIRWPADLPEGAYWLQLLNGRKTAYGKILLLK